MKERIKEYVFVILATILLFSISWVLFAPKAYVFPTLRYSCAANDKVYSPNQEEINQMIYEIVQDEPIYLFH